MLAFMGSAAAPLAKCALIVMAVTMTGAGIWAAPADAGPVQDVNILSLSCTAAGNCAAGGGYVVASSGIAQAFVVSEVNGHWGRAIQVPGIAVLEAGQSAPDEQAAVKSVSCNSAGNCAAGGSYVDSHGAARAFLVTEKNGHWRKAIEVPGTSAPDSRAFVNSVSCGSSGDCSAGGDFGLGGRSHAFVVVERNDTWGKAAEVRGAAPLASDGPTSIVSMACTSAGTCTAGGGSRDPTGRVQAFVVRESNGRWGKAIEIPGITRLNAHGYAVVTSLSCHAAGACAAGGTYVDQNSDVRGFVASEKNGQWGKAEDIPGLDILNAGHDEGVDSVSCGAAGNCAVVGFYRDAATIVHAFIATEQAGVWGRAMPVRGLPRPTSVGEYNFADSVSCALAGNCSAGGMSVHGGRADAFVVSETNGHWGKALIVPGSTLVNPDGEAIIQSVSCTSAGTCGAAGQTADSAGLQGLVVSERNGVWRMAQTVGIS